MRFTKFSGSKAYAPPTRCAAPSRVYLPELYEALSYYEKWTAALEILLIEKGILTADEIDAKTAVLREQGL